MLSIWIERRAYRWAVPVHRRELTGGQYLYREVSLYRPAVQFQDYEVNIQAEQLSGYSVGHTGGQYLDR